jgi:hypothetical protein
MLSLREFLAQNTTPPAPTMGNPANSAMGNPANSDKPSPELLALANKTKQTLGQAKNLDPNNPQYQNQIGLAKQLTTQLTNKAQQFQMQQADKMANQVLQTALQR